MMEKPIIIIGLELDKHPIDLLGILNQIYPVIISCDDNHSHEESRLKSDEIKSLIKPLSLKVVIPEKKQSWKRPYKYHQ